MKKYQRKIDQYYIERSKEKVINSVMEEINKDSWFVRLRKYRTVFVLGLMMGALALIALLSNNPVTDNQTPPNPVGPITLNETETVKFAEVGYLSGTLIASSFQLNETNMLRLNTSNQTEFESKFDEYHRYFHTLKVFLEPDYFKNKVELVASDKEEYGSKMVFDADGVVYTIYMNVEDENITGELYVNQKVFHLTGRFEEEENEFSLELNATNGENYIDISYDSEFGSETESEYSVESMINGVYEEKEISVSHEEDEYSVEMENTDSYFELTYELEDEGFVYILSYEINDQEGEVFITETTNSLGEIVYHYVVKEGDIETELDREKPSFDDEEEEDEEEEDEDEEEEIDEEEEEEIDTEYPIRQGHSKKIL